MEHFRSNSKYLPLYLCIFLIAGFLSGCGRTFRDVAEDASQVASGSAVSGSAVSKNKRTSEFDQKYPDFVGDVPTVLCTENYGYECGEEGEGEFMQVRLEDSQRREISWDKPENVDYIMGVLAVKNGFLYCITEEEEDEGNNGSLYQIPIEINDKGEETLLTEHAKPLLQGREEDCLVDFGLVYVGERYVICPKEDDSGDMMRLDLKTGEKTTFSGPMKEGYYDATDDFINCGDYLVAKVNDGVYAAHVEKGEWTKICSDGMFEEAIEIGSDAWNPEGYYYTGESEEFVGDSIPTVEVHRYDFQKEENSLWISEEQIQEAVKQAQSSEFDPDALDVCAVMRIYTQSDRVYVEVQSNWKKGEEYYVTYQVFSRGIEEKELRYEEALTECMKQHGSTRRGRFVGEHPLYEGMVLDHVVMEGAKLYAMVDGKAYMVCYDEEKKEEKRGEFTLADGEFRWLTNEDLDAWKWHIFFFDYDPEDLFYDEDDEPTDTVAKWGGRIGTEYTYSTMPGIMEVDDMMGFQFQQD